jgi:hypothetical protein
MRLSILALALILPAASALAQDSSPRRMLEEMGGAPSRGDVARAVERASSRPLGGAENPVRVNGPAGEHAYIARLRCADGNAPRVGERHNDGIGAFGTIVDVWPLDCGDAAPGRFDLIMDMYHDDYEETRAPAGFTLTRAGEEAAPAGKPGDGSALPTT